jgi:acetoin:2,6-dichlorophenolindophenol oxidoreductase subunit alpha
MNRQDASAPRPQAELPYDHLYRRMRLIRRFEERIIQLIDADRIAGVCHEYVGQEAVAVGVCTALAPDDVITSTHRGHGHILAKGGRPDRMMAELFGRSTGYNRGRGGSMHIADVGLGIFGANGIVGAGTPIACGAAWRFRRQDSRRVAVPFFGEGAINQGVVHESLNMAAIWSLPVLFVCENNRYAITTSISQSSLLPPHRRAEAYGMPAQCIDGMDVAAVFDATAAALARIRAGGGPEFLEFETYRFCGHYTAERFMKTSYRSAEEIDAWRARDPVSSWASRLALAGILPDDRRAAIDAEIEAELDAAVAYADASPWPDPSEALDHAHATAFPGMPAWGTQ